MRRLIYVGTALGLSVALIGCGKGKVGQEDGKSSAPAWTLKLKSACVYAAEDQCVGKYGFAVTADGKYVVGKGPKGQLREGTLNELDFADLKGKVSAALASLAASRAEGHESGVENEGDDTVTLQRKGGQETVVLHNTQGEYYYSTASSAEAKSLHKAIRDLAKSYYPLPFGNDCADAAAKVEDLYSGAQQCQVDSDCVYLRAGYEVVEPRSDEWVVTDACTAVKPLTVANRIKIQGAAPKLLEAYQSALNVCGNQFYLRGSLGCRSEHGRTTSAPVCVQNRCEARL